MNTRNIVLISIAVFVVVVNIGLYIVWSSQTASAKRAVEEMVDNINITQKYITYESLKTSGYPSKINVTITKPRFHGRVDILFKELAHSMAVHPELTTPPDLFSNMPAMDEDDMLNGDITLSVSVFSNQFDMTINGNWKETTKSSTQIFNASRQQAGNITCSLKIDHSNAFFASLWNFNTLLENKQDFINNLRMIDCNNPGNVITDSLSQAKLSSNGPMRLYIVNAPEAGANQIHATLKATDMEVTPDGDAMVAAYLQAFSPNNPFPVKFSSYGKQNLDLDFTYKGPTDWKPDNKNPAFDIALDKLDLSNQLYNYHTSFFFNNDPTGGMRKGRFAYRVEASFSDQYDAMLQNIARNAIQELYASKDPKLKDWQDDIQKYTPEQLYSILYPLMPNLHGMGTIVNALDASFQGSPDMSAGDANLADFEFSIAPYGIKANGATKLSANTLFPTGNATISCNNCMAMVDDMVAYAIRMQKVVSYFNPDKAASINIDAKLSDGMKGFLNALAGSGNNAADKSSLTYAIVSDSASGVTINSKRIDEVMALYSQYLGPEVSRLQTAITNASAPDQPQAGQMPQPAASTAAQPPVAGAAQAPAAQQPPLPQAH